LVSGLLAPSWSPSSSPLLVVLAVVAGAAGCRCAWRCVRARVRAGAAACRASEPELEGAVVAAPLLEAGAVLGLLLGVGEPGLLWCVGVPVSGSALASDEHDEPRLCWR
jgi:hypothetical protein